MVFYRHRQQAERSPLHRWQTATPQATRLETDGVVIDEETATTAVDSLACVPKCGRAYAWLDAPHCRNSRSVPTSRATPHTSGSAKTPNSLGTKRPKCRTPSPMPTAKNKPPSLSPWNANKTPAVPTCSTTTHWSNWPMSISSGAPMATTPPTTTPPTNRYRSELMS